MEGKPEVLVDPACCGLLRWSGIERRVDRRTPGPHYRCCVKNCISRAGSQSKLPGNGDAGKPACPPCSGCSSNTPGPASARPGNECGGMNGSFSALSTSVGTPMPLSHGLLLARVQ